MTVPGVEVGAVGGEYRRRVVGSRKLGDLVVLGEMNCNTVLVYGLGVHGPLALEL